MILPIDWLKDFIKADKSTQEMGNIYHGLGFTPDEINTDYLDLEITPNRGDAVSVFGLAREFRAYQSIKSDLYHQPDKPDKIKSDFVQFSQNAKLATPRFAYLIAHTDKVGESDSIVIDRLKRIGVNPKNKIVDITNYLMHESGQPLHAFDLSKIGGLRLDFASDGEQVNLIGNKKITSKKSNLVAYDSDQIVDLVGVCGCENSGVSDTSQSFLIQAAIFDPKVIRHSSKTSGVQTPASYRYERGVDPELPLQVLAKLKKFLIKWGFKVEEIVDIVNSPHQSNIIDFDISSIKKISGIEIDKDSVANILNNLGFKFNGNRVTVPSWRSYDVKDSVDVIEEVLRLNGYGLIAPEPIKPQYPKRSEVDSTFENLRAYLQNLGLTEVINYPFINKKELTALGLKEKDCTIITNPLSENYRYMRPSLKPKLVQAVSVNPWYDQIALFEIGNVFSYDKEYIHFGLISTEKNDMIGDIFGQTRHEEILPDSPLGKYYKLRRKCFYAEALIDKIKVPEKHERLTISTNKMRSISKYPPVVRDISLLVSTDIDVMEIAKGIQGVDKSILVVEPFDEYSNPKFGNKKSIALRITLQSLDHTLLADEVDKLFIKIIKLLEVNHGATIRK